MNKTDILEILEKFLDIKEDYRDICFNRLKVAVREPYYSDIEKYSKEIKGANTEIELLESIKREVLEFEEE